MRTFLQGKFSWNDTVPVGSSFIRNPATAETPPPEAPLVKSPFYCDYGTNVHVATSAFIHRNCYFQDSPCEAIVIGEGTVIGPNVHIQTVKHADDWRERQGVYGPA